MELGWSEAPTVELHFNFFATNKISVCGVPLSIPNPSVLWNVIGAGMELECVAFLSFYTIIIIIPYCFPIKK